MMKKLLLIPLVAAMAWAGPPVGPVTITQAQCKDHKLPPVSLRLDTQGTNMMTSVFPEEGTYLRLSGPPGGPLMFEIKPCRDMAKCIAAHFPEAEMGKAGKAHLAGKLRATLGFVNGKSLARTRWCAAYLEPEGLLALFGVSAGQAPPDDGLSALQHQSLIPIVKSLRTGD